VTRAGSARWLVLVTMCAGYFLVLLDVTVVNVALPAIQAGTGAGVAGLQWVVDGYALALAALLLAAGLAVAAAGVALLATWEADTPYWRLFPAMLAWGVGLGLLTPGVVTAAIGAAPPARSGLASGVNNTGRQAGGAMGIAVYGAVAGAPGTRHFLAGLHATGLVTAGLYAAMALAAGLLMELGAWQDQTL